METQTMTLEMTLEEMLQRGREALRLQREQEESRKAEKAERERQARIKAWSRLHAQALALLPEALQPYVVWLDNRDDPIDPVDPPEIFSRGDVVLDIPGLAMIAFEVGHIDDAEHWVPIDGEHGEHGPVFRVPRKVDGEYNGLLGKYAPAWAWSYPHKTNDLLRALALAEQKGQEYAKAKASYDDAAARLAQEEQDRIPRRSLGKQLTNFLTGLKSS